LCLIPQDERQLGMAHTTTTIHRAPPSQQGTLRHLGSLSDQQRTLPDLSFSYRTTLQQNGKPSIPAWLPWLPNLLMLLVATVAVLVSWASSLLVIQD
jgi:hypothetical protein